MIPKRWLWLMLVWLSLGWSASALAQISGLQPDSGPELPHLRFFGDHQQSQAEVEKIQSLFDREPWIFNPETLPAVWQDLQQLPVTTQRVLGNLMQHHWAQQNLLWGLGLVAVLVLLGLFFWIDRRFQSLPTHLLPLLPAHWLFWVRRLVKVALVVAARLGLSLSLLFVVHLLWGLFPGSQTWFPLLIDMLWIWLAYRGVQSLLHEVLIQEREHFFQAIPTQTTQGLYWRLIGFALFSALFWSGIVACQDLGYRADFVELLQFIFSCSLFVFSGYLISRKADVFSLFPEIDEPVYQRFLALLQRFYLYVSGFTLLLGMLWIVGYRYLSTMLFLRSWALVGLVLGMRLGHRWLKQMLSKRISPAQETSRLRNALLNVLALVEVLVLLNGLLALLGVRSPIFTLLAQPIASIGEKSVISPLSFLNGVLTLLIFWMLVQIINAFLEERIFPTRFETNTHQIISMLIFYSVMALGALMALNVTGLDLSIFAIFAGALAFGIGFGLQGVAKSFASGMTLIFTGLVKKGDLITLGEHTGYIHDISWKRVLMRTPESVDIIIPAVDLVESTIVNWSYSSKEVRIHVPVRVAYGSDMECVKQALLEAAAEHPAVLKSPEATVWMVKFDDSAVNFELLVWINAHEIIQQRLKGELNFMIWRAFQRYKIEIPLPQRDLHLRSLPPIKTRPADAERDSSELN